MKFKEKPTVIDAIHWTGEGEHTEKIAMLNKFCGRNWARADAVDEAGPDDPENVVVWNSNGQQWLNVPLGYWIIRGVDGDLYTCPPELFEKTYEAAE